jgi:hypothetical protein
MLKAPRLRRNALKQNDPETEAASSQEVLHILPDTKLQNF